jgi:SNF2 family DNA or RNA helicase/uncharacterized Zn finger protein
MAQFGRTWWGEQWLHALDRIDFSNRLERGRRYANNGSVLSINTNGNIIEAKVQGSQRKPYSVTIVVPPFFDEQKLIFIKHIRENPLLLSRLLNRELPNELLQFGDQNSLKIFPGSWQDIKLNCSCPDWAVPCKHLAAVIYMVANEIDQNPFLVFKLHNFDIVVELSKLKIEIGNLQEETIFSLSDCIQMIPARKKEKQTEAKPEAPDFSTLENILNTLPNLFPANTLFYSGDFKSILQSFYKRAAKMESHALQEKKKSVQSVNGDLRFQKFRIIVSQLTATKIEMSAENKKTVLPIPDLILLLARTESKHLENYSTSFVALYRIFRYCNILVERGAVVPRLLNCSENNYKMLWLPALLNESVKSVFDKLLFWLPEDIVGLDLGSARKYSSKDHKTNQPIVLPKRSEALQLICSIFINHSVAHCYSESPLIKTKGESDAKILKLFFTDSIVRFSNFNEKEIPNTLQLWLKRFYLSDKNIVPVISIQEFDGRFEVETLVQKNNDKFQTKESLFSFMRSASEENKMNLLKDLNLLSEYYPELNKIIQSQGKQKLIYKQHAFSDVLLKILPALKMFGIKALLPKSLQQLLRPQVSLKLKASTKHKSYFTLDGLMDYHWQVAVGDTFMSKSEFEQLAKSTLGLVKIREQYMMVDEEELRKIIRKLEEPVAPTGFQLLQAALSGEHENAAVQIDDALKQQIKNLLKEETTPIPATLQATLRPYQHRGFNWIYKNSKLGLGSLLADDMGLGKTLQVITALLKFKEEGLLNSTPALIIVPTTLLTNWVSEIQKFAPKLQTYIYHGTGRKFMTRNTDVLITTYGIARTDNARFIKIHWPVVIVDEAQNIKNPEVAQTKSVKNIKAKNKIALSGTPVENRLSEYWSIFDFVNPNYLGGINWFNNEYAKPIELNQDRNKLDKFKLITSPFIMRRVKTDKSIINDLPNKIENNQYCNLSKEQAALYQNITSDLMQQVEIAEGISRRGLVLKLLLTLKQVCNHPSQYLKNDSHAPELSNKTMLLLQVLDTIYENNEKVLIFSQFKEMGDILRQIIYTRFGKKALQLHGGCSRKERDEMVHSFQNNKHIDTFILSIKAGGTGLNLTAAANVIHYDLWWNPAVEAQATDRAFRIGQKQNVMVHRMITKGTLEEKIDEMIRSKRQLANLTVSNGEKWIGEMSDKDLKSLVALGQM